MFLPGILAKCFNPFRQTEGNDVSVQVERRVTATMHAWGVENADETPTLATIIVATAISGHKTDSIFKRYVIMDPSAIQDTLTVAK